MFQDCLLFHVVSRQANVIKRAEPMDKDSDRGCLSESKEKLLSYQRRIRLTGKRSILQTMWKYSIVLVEVPIPIVSRNRVRPIDLEIHLQVPLSMANLLTDLPVVFLEIMVALV
jgi:hypothetical protein